MVTPHFLLLGNVISSPFLISIRVQVRSAIDSDLIEKEHPNPGIFAFNQFSAKRIKQSFYIRHLIFALAGCENIRSKVFLCSLFID